MKRVGQMWVLALSTGKMSLQHLVSQKGQDGWFGSRIRGGGIVPSGVFSDWIEVPDLPLNRGYNRVRGGYQTLSHTGKGNPAR